jgi:hypothetical protein
MITSRELTWCLNGRDGLKSANALANLLELGLVVHRQCRRFSDHADSSRRRSLGPDYPSGDPRITHQCPSYAVET